MLYMSAGDYIALKKSKILKNYGIPTATANKSPYVHTSYDHYIHNVALVEATTTCSRFRNGIAKPVSINGVLVGRTGTCPVNTYDGPTIVRTTGIATNADLNQSIPEISVPSIPPKNQTDSCKGPCRAFIQIGRIYNFNSLYPKQTRQWNLKKAQSRVVIDSTTLQM
jgi:hypothetical protein